MCFNWQSMLLLKRFSGSILRLQILNFEEVSGFGQPGVKFCPKKQEAVNFVIKTINIVKLDKRGYSPAFYYTFAQLFPKELISYGYI